MYYLDRHATIADVISWVLAVPAVLIGVMMAPYMLVVIPHFKPMFAALTVNCRSSRSWSSPRAGGCSRCCPSPSSPQW